MQTLLYIYLTGLAIGILVECYKFSRQIKLLTSFGSFIFMLLESIKQMIKHTLWPILAPIVILQIPFAKGILDESNELLSEYHGYDLEDDKED